MRPPGGSCNFNIWCLKGAFPFDIPRHRHVDDCGSFEVFAALILGMVIDRRSRQLQTAVCREPPADLRCGCLLIVIRPIAFGASSMFTSILIAPNLGAQVLTRLHRHTMKQSVSFFDDDFDGRISQKQLQASRAVTDTVVEFVNAISFAAASLVGIIPAAVINQSQDCGRAGRWLVCYVMLIWWFLPRIRHRSALRAGARSNLSGQIVDTITNIRTVKLFAHHASEDRAALDALENFRIMATGFGVVASSFRFFLMLLSGTPAGHAGRQRHGTVDGGMATAGDIAATGSVSIRIAQMSGWISFVMMAIYSNVGEAEDGMRTLAHPHQMEDGETSIELGRPEGRIAFSNVSFSYGRQIGGIADINLEVGQGEHVGLVGESGAGKSTVAALLMRLYDPECGSVRIDGIDLRDITQESLRRQISMVTQETAMFNRSAMDNISYGRPAGTREEVFAAARKAEAHEFILGLSDQVGRDRV